MKPARKVELNRILYLVEIRAGELAIGTASPALPRAVEKGALRNLALRNEAAQGADPFLGYLCRGAGDVQHFFASHKLKSVGSEVGLENAALWVKTKRLQHSALFEGFLVFVMLDNCRCESEVMQVPGATGQDRGDICEQSRHQHSYYTSYPP